jgi:mono/diheme cytochrome c family protein
VFLRLMRLPIDKTAMIGRGAGLLVLFGVSTVSASGCGDGPEERGRQLYAQHGCAVCHGAHGRGDGPSAKRLDAPPRDFADAGSYKQGSSVSDLAASIRNGAGAMPAFRNISDDDASDIAAWIVSLQQRPAGSKGQP